MRACISLSSLDRKYLDCPIGLCGHVGYGRLCQVVDGVLQGRTVKRWVADSPQETSIPGISSKGLLSKHDGTTSRNIGSSSSDNGLAALVNKLDNLGQDMKKLKESVHAIQVGCQICEGPHLDKDYPLNKEVKQVEEVRYGEFGRRMPFNGNNGGKFRVGPPRYYTKMITVHSWAKVTIDHETSRLNKLHGLSFMSGPGSDTPEVLQHQLPLKDLNPGSFTFQYMSKKAPLGIVENVLVKIDKFLFPSDFIIIDNTPSETTIIGRPFLATIHVEIDVFAGKISLGINEDRISFDTMRKDHNYTNPSEKNFMVNSGLINRPQSPAQSNNQIDYEESEFPDAREAIIETVLTHSHVNQAEFATLNGVTI
ncbi:putative reverse transcriptase domain-containing protein [Tanacetum coccineum]